MSQQHITLLLQESPYRSIALATKYHALILTSTSPTSSPRNQPDFIPHSPANSSLNLNHSTSPLSRCIAQFCHIDDLSQQGWNQLGHAKIYGTLGLVSLNGDVFVCVVSDARKVADPRPGETIQRISAVEFRERNPIRQVPIANRQTALQAQSTTIC